MPHPQVFATHAYVKRLKAVGFTEVQVGADRYCIGIS